MSIFTRSCIAAVAVALLGMCCQNHIEFACAVQVVVRRKAQEEEEKCGQAFYWSGGHDGEMISVDYKSAKEAAENPKSSNPTGTFGEHRKDSLVWIKDGAESYEGAEGATRYMCTKFFWRVPMMKWVYYDCKLSPESGFTVPACFAWLFKKKPMKIH